MQKMKLETRSYGFKELASLYFPNISPTSASTRLKQWILDSDILLSKLEETGYKRTNRLLTPRQKDLLISEFGSPI